MLVSIGAILFYPIPYQIVSEWNLQVMDSFGNRLPDALVRQTWRDYSVEPPAGYGHEEAAVTDEHGYVSFPERSGRAGLFFRGLGFFAGALSLHGRSGPSAHIVAYKDLVSGKRWEGSAQYDPGNSPPQQLETSLIELFPWKYSEKQLGHP